MVSSLTLPGRQLESLGEGERRKRGGRGGRGGGEGGGEWGGRKWRDEQVHPWKDTHLLFRGRLIFTLAGSQGNVHVAHGIQDSLHGARHGINTLPPSFPLSPHHDAEFVLNHSLLTLNQEEEEGDEPREPLGLIRLPARTHAHAHAHTHTHYRCESDQCSRTSV